MSWNILDTGLSSAQENMRIDTELLKNLEFDQTPMLHFYDWEADSATYGHFIRPFEHLNIEVAKKKNLQLAKRPTGGGIIFHLWDFTFSLLIPATHSTFSRNTLENYATVNSCTASVIHSFFGKDAKLFAKKTNNSCFCMANPTIYDVIIEGRKVGGAAQRCTKYGFLHQGSLSLTLPSSDYLKGLLPITVVEEMHKWSYPLLPESSDVNNAKEELKNLFHKEVVKLGLS